MKRKPYHFIHPNEVKYLGILYTTDEYLLGLGHNSMPEASLSVPA